MGLGTITKTGQDVARSVRRSFGDESSVQVTDADLVGWINDGIREIAQKLRINRRRGYTDVIDGQSEYTFNDLEILEIESLMVDKVVITGLEYEEAEQQLFSMDPHNEAYGRPKFWYVYENKVHLWPTPDFDATAGICILYIASPGSLGSLSDALTVPDKHFNALTNYVLAQAYRMDEDAEWFTLTMQQFTADLDGQLDEDKITVNRSFPTILDVQDY